VEQQGHDASHVRGFARARGSGCQRDQNDHRRQGTTPYQDAFQRGWRAASVETRASPQSRLGSRTSLTGVSAIQVRTQEKQKSSHWLLLSSQAPPPEAAQLQVYAVAELTITIFSTGNSRATQPSSPPCKGRTRVMPRLFSCSATRALVA